MFPEGGLGSGTSAPSVNEIYKAIYGIEGYTMNPARALIPGGHPIKSLPTIEPDGTIDLPKDDGLPGKSQSGIPATTSDKKEKKQQRYRRRQRGDP